MFILFYNINSPPVCWVFLKWTKTNQDLSFFPLNGWRINIVAGFLSIPPWALLHCQHWYLGNWPASISRAAWRALLLCQSCWWQATGRQVLFFHFLPLLSKHDYFLHKYIVRLQLIPYLLKANVRSRYIIREWQSLTCLDLLQMLWRTLGMPNSRYFKWKNSAGTPC